MKLSHTAKRSYEAAANHYHQSVTEASTYLGGRGLWDPQIVDTYRLGVVADPLPEHEHVAGRLSIPYLTPNGVVNLKFRCIEAHDCRAIEGHVKYLGLKGAEDRVYNVQALHDAADSLYIAEGELDALTASVVGFPAVGISGATKWRPHYAKLFEDFREVVVLADGDEAGKDFGRMVRDELRNARVVHMPKGEDVNSFLNAREVDEFRELVYRRV